MISSAKAEGQEEGKLAMAKNLLSMGWLRKWSPRPPSCLSPKFWNCKSHCLIKEGQTGISAV
jgi:hypothetical protein